MPTTAYFSPTTCRLWQGFFIAGAPDVLQSYSGIYRHHFQPCPWWVLLWYPAIAHGLRERSCNSSSNDLPQCSHALPLSCRPAVPCPCEPCPAPNGLYSFGARWANAHFPAFWQYAIRPLDDFIFLAFFCMKWAVVVEGLSQNKIFHALSMPFQQLPAPDALKLCFQFLATATLFLYSATFLYTYTPLYLLLY